MKTQTFRLLTRFCHVVTLALLSAHSLLAQDPTTVSLITETRVHLHSQPTTGSGVIKTLAKNTTLSVVHPNAFRSDFLRVVVADEDTGWVAFAYVRSSDEPLTSNTSPTNVETQIDGEDNPLPVIDPPWEKPRLTRSIFVASDGSRCDAEGLDGSDWRTNIRKNRIDAPVVSHAIKWEPLADTITLPFARGGLPKKRSGWNGEEALEVARYEGIPVTVVGCLVKIKPPSSNAEDTNRDFTGEANTDWHVAFVGLHDGEESESVVIEPTPRFEKETQHLEARQPPRI